MNKLFILFTSLLCYNSVTEIDILFKNYLLTQAEIETTLGQTASLTLQSDSTGAGYYLRMNRVYTGIETDKKTGQPSNLYYFFERFASEEIADQTIDSFITSNENSGGYQVLTGVGDEGFFKTDKQNYCIFIARKGKLLIRIKVNKLTSKTDLETFKQISSAVLARL